ncbi:hypothetical protein EX30DRAFT_365582 [Ascodesmis nigricans]|uniref:Uncharacterized protein n=1 Tax=Ascodesmis nigricans TaxID=341454 RepID=A0A4S2MNX4_9PEZI|nr:hypothetical protein EX30DRAFT_365582 [Ascodesmis nigricans]
MLPPNFPTAPLFLLFLLPGSTLAQPSASRPPPTATTSLHAIPRSLTERQQHCTEQGSELCSNLPNTKFCCPTGTECIPLDSGSSVICCKLGEQCDQIRPVDCPVAGASTESTITTTNLKCGSLCCPLGFECSVDGKTCNMKSANLPSHYTRRPTDTTPSPPTVITPGLTSSASASSTTFSTINLDSSSCQPNDFPSKAILAGFFPGLLFGALLLFLATRIRLKILAYRSRRRRSIKSFCPPPPPINISEPIIHHRPIHPTISTNTSTREDAAKVLAWSSGSPMTPFGPFSARARGGGGGGGGGGGAGSNAWSNNSSSSSNATSFGNFIHQQQENEKPRLVPVSAPWTPDTSTTLAGSSVPARLRTVASSSTMSSAHQQHPGATALPQTATVSHTGWGGLGRELVGGMSGGPGQRGTMMTVTTVGSEGSVSPLGWKEGIRPLSSTPVLAPLRVNKVGGGGGMGGRTPGGFV